MSKNIKILAILIVAILMIPQVSQSIPAFARKYGFNCNMCHVAFTKLSDFGQKFRAFGYQIPGQEGKEKNVIEETLPLAARTTFGMISAHTSDANTIGFNLNSFDLLAAGVLHKNISFLLIYTPRLDEPAADYTGPDNGRNPSQLGAVESAGLLFSNVVRDAVNIRVGRFEPAYHPFSGKRSFYLIQPYEIYTFTTPGNDFVFDDNQMGLEITGHFRNRFSYGCGIVNGTGGSPDNNRAKDVYLRAAQVLGRGEGQTAGQRLGLFGYFGWHPTVPGAGNPELTGEGNGGTNETFSRIGGDISLNWKTFNLHGMFMHGIDSKEIDLGASEDYKFNGGFAQLDYAGLLNNRLIGSLMYNWVTPPDSDEERQISAYSVLARYYLGDWTAVNVALHAEYTHREVGNSDKVKSDKLALLVDFAF
jgi:hypothetical protein